MVPQWDSESFQNGIPKWYSKMGVRNQIPNMSFSHLQKAILAQEFLHQASPWHGKMMPGGSPTNVHKCAASSPNEASKPQHFFQGDLVHVLQIGLGTHDTFLDDDTSWGTAFFVNASSHASGEKLRGIGVDPFEECVRNLRSVAEDMDQISIVLGSVGEFAGWGTVFCVP